MSINITQEKSYIYQAIASYYGNIICTKGKDVDKFSIYYTNVSGGCLLCLEDRYLVVIVDKDSFLVGNQERLRDLHWVSFQTRTMDMSPIPNMRSTPYTPILEHKFLHDKITLAESKNDRNIYFSTTYPLRIELLFSDDASVYSENGTIKSALDTFNCSIILIL